MRPPFRGFPREPKIKTNDLIRALELRVIGAAGENLGVISKAEALAKAREAELDLIEISPNAVPPVAKIADFGRFQYELAKKTKAAKAGGKGGRGSEVKEVQVKIGTSENDLSLKAKKASEWLALGNRVKVELFLPGRAKYLDEAFLKTRLLRVLKLVSVNHKVAEQPKRHLKGFTMIIERA
ncbi:MAG TPA: translation initiation factor IF-3 [Candidatus Paceibacterota bacterium]